MRRAHVGGDGHEFVGVAGMVATAVHQVQGVPARPHVEVDGRHAGHAALEIEAHDAAVRARQLILCAARLPEMHVLRPRSFQRERGEVALRSGPVRLAHRADQQPEQHLEGGRRGHAVPCGNVRARHRVEAAHHAARARECRRHAAHEGARRPPFLLARFEVADVHKRLAEALHADADVVGAVRRGQGEHAQADGGGDGAPALMVGMVAGQLHPPGRGGERERATVLVAEQRGESTSQLHKRFIFGSHRAPPSASLSTRLS